MDDIIELANSLLEIDDRTRSCNGKIKHSKQSALIAAFNLNSSSKTNGEEYEPYKCRHCPKWHVGHSSGSARPRRSCSLLIAAEDGSDSIVACKGDRKVREAVTVGIRVRRFPKGPLADGFWVLDGGMIKDSRGQYVIGNVRPANPNDETDEEWFNIKRAQ